MIKLKFDHNKGCRDLTSREVDWEKEGDLNALAKSVLTLIQCPATLWSLWTKEIEYVNVIIHYFTE